MYDVIVVGAGATGCTVAKTLSENGYKVLLVEKFKMPRYAGVPNGIYSY